MEKIERKYLAHFINAAASGEEAVYVRLGKDLEEFAPEMAAEVETKKNILGETNVLISGYQKTASVEPYYAENGSELFERLQAIIDGNLVQDALRTDVIEVKLWKEAADGAYEAYKEEAYIEVTSYGGDTTGYQIPFTVNYVGDKVSGYYNSSDGSFAADAS